MADMVLFETASAVDKLAGRLEAWERWQLTGLSPMPEEAWRRMQSFLDLGPADFAAMVETIEPLLKRAHEMVVANYDHLLADHETAAILGWEEGADPSHLAERRRFFTIWIARTLGMDLSDDFARYLFRAGQYHAAHGPRQIHVPEIYVTGAVSLVNAGFARILSEDMPAHPAVAPALAGWNKVLAMHLNAMLDGYRVARALDRGDFAVTLRLFGQMRDAAGRAEVAVRVPQGATAADVLRKFFDYYPALRRLVFDVEWDEHLPEHAGGKSWMTAERAYTIKLHPAWRALLNGRNLSHLGGPEVAVKAGDVIRLYSPGR